MTDQDPSFADFGDEFQDRVVQALMHDANWAEQMIEIIKVEYFALEHLQYVVSKWFSYYHKYRSFPSIPILATIISEGLDGGRKYDEALADKIVDFLVKTKENPDLNDLPYVKDKALDFCRNQAMKDALDQSVELWNRGDHGEIIEIMKKALTAGEEVSMGHDFEADLEARLLPISRATITTGIPEWDKALDGGWGRGELCIFVAAPGVGKSHLLCAAGAAAIKEGYNVVHYSLEMGEDEVGRRYDAWLTNIDSREIHDNADTIREFYKSANGTLGRLMIKEYPSQSATSLTLRAHLQRLEFKKKFKPDLIIVDYADEMCSTKSFDSSESRHTYKAIYRDLRNLGREFNPRVPVLSASQSNRAGSSADIVTGENMAESYRKLDVPDIVITGATKPQEKETGAMRAFFAKFRHGSDGMIMPMFVDKRYSRFTCITEAEYSELAVSEEEAADKQKKKYEGLAKPLKRMKKEIGGTTPIKRPKVSASDHKKKMSAEIKREENENGM